jgi:hypothetical protein
MQMPSKTSKQRKNESQKGLWRRNNEKEGNPTKVSIDRSLRLVVDETGEAEEENKRCIQCETDGEEKKMQQKLTTQCVTSS